MSSTPEVYGAVNTDTWGQKRIGDWIQTYTGKRFHLLDPRPEDFCILDIAHALSNICRFTGHVSKFYSVAEHLVRVSEAVKMLGGGRQSQYEGLMHDATEAYICDVARPFKQLPEFKFYREIEAELEKHIASVFCFTLPLNPYVKQADEMLLGTEARDLMGNPIDGWHFRYQHLSHKIRPWSPRKAQWRFLKAYERLAPTVYVRRRSLFSWF